MQENQKVKITFTMALESVDVAPSLADFMLLSEHQQTTPGTFFGGKPVLHLHSPGADVRIARADIVSQPTLSALLGATSVRNEVEEEETIKDIDAWISSRYSHLVCVEYMAEDRN